MLTTVITLASLAAAPAKKEPKKLEYLWQRIPIAWFWFTVGLSYEVAFNNRQNRPYDFSVTGTLGVGFSRG